MSNNSLKDISPEVKENLSKLTKRAMGSDSQTSFANRSNISRETINRLVNMSLPNLPSNATISAIVKNSNGRVSYNDFALIIDRPLETNSSDTTLTTIYEALKNLYLLPDFVSRNDSVRSDYEFSVCSDTQYCFIERWLFFKIPINKSTDEFELKTFMEKILGHCVMNLSTNPAKVSFITEYYEAYDIAISLNANLPTLFEVSIILINHQKKQIIDETYLTHVSMFRPQNLSVNYEYELFHFFTFPEARNKNYFRTSKGLLLYPEGLPIITNTYEINYIYEISYSFNDCRKPIFLLLTKYAIRDDSFFKRQIVSDFLKVQITNYSLFNNILVFDITPSNENIFYSLNKERKNWVIEYPKQCKLDYDEVYELRRDSNGKPLPLKTVSSLIRKHYKNGLLY